MGPTTSPWARRPRGAPTERPPTKRAPTERAPTRTGKKRELEGSREEVMTRKKGKKVVNDVCSSAKDASPPGSPGSSKGATLKDRVGAILQRHSAPPLPRVESPVNRSCRDLLFEDHPLKLRVKALMRRRRRGPHRVAPTNGEVPVIPPTRPGQSDEASLVTEESRVNLGFQRFLAVLNQGVDLELLDRVVTDDGEDLPPSEEPPDVRPLAVENKSGLPSGSEGRGSDGGTSPLGNDGGRKSNPPSQERSPSVQRPRDSQSSDRLDVGVGSCGRSRSPSPVKETREGEEGKPKVNEQHEQLQNILKCLGLSLEEDEMTRLAQRTQERLYGKRDEGKRDDGRREQASEPRGPSEPSSGSSSSSPLGSMSRSPRPSPSRRRRSHSGDSRRRRASDGSGSASGSGGGRTSRGDDRDGNETAKHEDGSRFDEISTYQHPYPQNQSEARSQPGEFSAFSNYTQSQFSQYDGRCGSYSAATVSRWTFTQKGTTAALDPSGYPPAQNSHHHLHPASATLDCLPATPKDPNLLVNPDLSECEGQTGSVYGPRCLSDVSAKQAGAKQAGRGRGANPAGAESVSNSEANKVSTKKLSAKLRKKRLAAKASRKRLWIRRYNESIVAKVLPYSVDPVSGAKQPGGDREPPAEEQEEIRMQEVAERRRAFAAYRQALEGRVRYRPEASEKFHECQFDYNLL